MIRRITFGQSGISAPKSAGRAEKKVTFRSILSAKAETGPEKDKKPSESGETEDRIESGDRRREKKSRGDGRGKIPGAGLAAQTSLPLEAAIVPRAASKADAGSGKTPVAKEISGQDTALPDGAVSLREDGAARFPAAPPADFADLPRTEPAEGFLKAVSGAGQKEKTGEAAGHSRPLLSPDAELLPAPSGIRNPEEETAADGTKAENSVPKERERTPGFETALFRAAESPSPEIQQKKGGAAKAKDGILSAGRAQGSGKPDREFPVSPESGSAVSEPDAPALAGRVALTAAGKLQAGKKEFTMELYPKSLGKVSVRMTAEDGVLTVEISASSPKTQSLLLSNADEIRSILRPPLGQGVRVLEADVPWYAELPQDGRENRRERRKREESGFRERAAAMNPSGAGTADFLALLQIADKEHGRKGEFL